MLLVLLDNPFSWVLEIKKKKKQKKIGNSETTINIIKKSSPKKPRSRHCIIKKQRTHHIFVKINCWFLKNKININSIQK